MKKYLFCLLLWSHLCSAYAAEIDRASVEKLLTKASQSQPADLRRKDLTDLDLSQLDFTHADLWGSDYAEPISAKAIYPV